MWKLLLASTLVPAALISAAKAQNAPAAPAQTTQPSEGGAMTRGMMGDQMGHEMGERTREGPMGMAMMMAHTTGAIFHLRRGDTSIFIKCGENESTQACVTAAGALLDKFNPPRP